MQHDKHHNSPVKIVAGENTTENFNEQVEAAPVINQLNNKEIVMEEIGFQNSIAPQDGANETTFCNAEETVVESVDEVTFEKDRRYPNSSYAYEMACLGSLYDGTFFEDLWSVDEAKNLSMESSRDENRDGNDN